MKELFINVPGNVSLAEPNPTATLHIDEMVEVARVFPVYQCLSDGKKLYVLNNLVSWCRDEMARLEKRNVGEQPTTAAAQNTVDTLE